MLDTETKARIDSARDILVGKVPDPKGQVEQITIALIYKFMDDMDRQSEEIDGKTSFFSGEFKKYRWSNLLDKRLSGHERLSLYSEGLDKMNVNKNIPQLFRDIFKGVFLPYRDPETLNLFLKEIDGFTYDHSERLGDAFEYLLSVLGTQGDAGQFRTPRHIIDFIVTVVDPKKNETVLDPACGTAGFLISAFKHIRKANMNLTPDESARLMTNFRGYDIAPDMVRLSRVNMYLHKFAQPRIHEYDTLASEERWDERCDVILANPPFMSPTGGIRPHNRFSIKANRSEVLFVDYIAEHLNPVGRAGVIVPEGIIFKNQNAYKALRRMLIENYLWAVVSLPAGVFNPYAGVKTSILFLDRNLAKRTENILFVKVENDGFDLGAQRRPNGKNDLLEALGILNSHKKSQKAQEGKMALTVSRKRLLESGDINLSGSRYREIAAVQSRWPMVKLGSIFETTSGGTPLRSKPAFYEGGTIPWLKSGEVAQGLVFQAEEKITEAGLKNSSAKMFPIDTVLVAMYGATAGQVGLLKIEAATNQAICGILPNDKCIPEFLYQIMRALTKRMVELSGGGAQPNISQKIIRDLTFPLPPLEIQRQMVTELDGYQNIITSARQILASYKPTIRIDPTWPRIRLDEVCEINPKKSEVSSLDMNLSVSFVPMEDVGMVQYITPQKEKPLGEVYKGYTYFRDNDVLVAKVTPCFENGKSGIARYLKNGIGFGSSELHVIRPSKKLLPEFIYPFVTSEQFRRDGKIKMTGTGGLQRVPSAHVADFEIPLPPLATQRKIVAEIEAERVLVEASRKLVDVFEKKIQVKLAEVWGEGISEGEHNDRISKS